MSSLLRIISATVFFALVQFAANARAVPELLSYQGKLYDQSGSPVNATVNVTFSLYGQATEGTSVWSETQNVEVTEGIFNILLGSVEPLTASVRQQGRLYLGVKVGADTEMTPRQLITSGLYDHSAVPVGTIMAWAKSMPSMPGLPEEWVECNGQTLNDAASLLNGQVVPNLNGENRFLRGDSASGEVGGTTSHRHSISLNNQSYDPGSQAYNNSSNRIDTTTTEHIPPYYGVVWIMKVK